MTRIYKIDAEDIGTARVIARARREIAAGSPLFSKHVADRLAQKKRPIRASRKRRVKGK